MAFKEFVPTDKQLEWMARKIAEMIPQRATYREKLRRYSPMTPLNWRLIEQRWDDVISAAGKLEKAQEQQLTAAAGQCNKILIDKLRAAQNDLVLFVSDLENRNKYSAGTIDVRGILQDLKNLRDLSGVPFQKVTFMRGADATDTYIACVTEDITLMCPDDNGEDIPFEMGPYEIRFNLWEYASSPNNRPFRATALRPNTSADGYTHPHMDTSGMLCEGSAPTDINAALDDGRILDALSMWVAILRVYNEGSAFRELYDWGEYGEDEEGYSECEDCGDEIGDGSACYCERCGTTSCSQCAVSCSCCDERTCYNCRRGCAACTEHTCNRSACSDVCHKCGRRYCDNCLIRNGELNAEHSQIQAYREGGWLQLCHECVRTCAKELPDDVTLPEGYRDDPIVFSANAQLVKLTEAAPAPSSEPTIEPAVDPLLATLSASLLTALSAQTPTPEQAAVQVEFQQPTTVTVTPAVRPLSAIFDDDEDDDEWEEDDGWDDDEEDEWEDDEDEEEEDEEEEDDSWDDDEDDWDEDEELDEDEQAVSTQQSSHVASNGSQPQEEQEEENEGALRVLARIPADPAELEELEQLRAGIVG